MTARDPENEKQKLQVLSWAVGGFLMQFAAVESRGVTDLFQSIGIIDVDILNHLEELMPLEGRLKLMKRVATGRKKSLPPELLAELIDLANKIDKLRLRRNAVAHGEPATWFVGQDLSEPIVGLQLPKSQREPITGETSEERVESQKSNVITAEEIWAYKAEAEDLSGRLAMLDRKMSRARDAQKPAGSSDPTEPPKP